MDDIRYQQLADEIRRRSAPPLVVHLGPNAPVPRFELLDPVGPNCVIMGVTPRIVLRQGPSQESTIRIGVPRPALSFDAGSSSGSLELPASDDAQAPTIGQLQAQDVVRHSATFQNQHVLGVEGCFLTLDGEPLQLGERRTELTASQTKRCKLLLGMCIQSHHRERLSRLFAPYPRIAPDLSELAQAIALATGDQVEVRRSRGEDAARLSMPVYLNDALVSLAMKCFPWLDASTIEASRAPRT